MATTDWADLNAHGRRMNAIIKQMYSKAKKQTDPTMEMAYIDRAVKTTNTITNIIEVTMNIKRTLKEAQKQAGTTGLINT